MGCLFSIKYGNLLNSNICSYAPFVGLNDYHLPITFADGLKVISLFTFLTKGGNVLWSKSWVLSEERAREIYIKDSLGPRIFRMQLTISESESEKHNFCNSSVKINARNVITFLSQMNIVKRIPRAHDKLSIKFKEIAEGSKKLSKFILHYQFSGTAERSNESNVSLDAIRRQKTESFKSVKQRILTPKSSVYLLRDITQAQSYSCPCTICFISNGVAKIITKRVAMREMRRPPDFILEIPIKDFFARQMKLSYARKILSFRTSKTISYDSEWKISFMSDNDIETGFLVHLQTLDILDTKKVLPFIMTDEIYQVCLPLARILDIIANMKERSNNITNPSCRTMISVEKLALVHNMDPRNVGAMNISTNLPRLIWLIQNELKVLIRLGGVEQLRIHVRNLNALSQNSNVELYDEVDFIESSFRIFLDHGMILTKLDIVDDKVGAALSMTYTIEQLILFVGTGQTYTNLKNM
ncbi:signal recognition particle receptor subunit alpha-like [Rhizophagus irregularis DAOM 181602=DAOM 197198]|nr:signal recognition particle receptor subunit alpha-like [Rhizophagus irregularis DAOM 181602=DAOM 197198]